MPSGKTVTVERVVNGGLTTRFDERFEVESFVVVLQDEEDPTHVHVVVGTKDDLDAVDIEVPASDVAAAEKAEKEQAKAAEQELKDAKAEAKAKSNEPETVEVTARESARQQAAAKRS
jgi:ribosome-binding ATPase YchF (GTP1/OBG family)